MAACIFKQGYHNAMVNDEIKWKLDEAEEVDEEEEKDEDMEDEDEEEEEEA